MIKRYRSILENIIMTKLEGVVQEVIPIIWCFKLWTNFIPYDIEQILLPNS